jgi:hypothetical protein
LLRGLDADDLAQAASSASWLILFASVLASEREASDLAQAASSASFRLILFECGGDASVFASERESERKSCFHPGTGTFAIIGIWISSDSGIVGAKKAWAWWQILS